MNEGLAQLQNLDAAAATQSFLAYGVVLVSLVLCALGGLRVKLFRSILAFGSFVIAIMTAFVMCETVGGMSRLLGVPARWSLVAGYSMVFVATLAFVNFLCRLLVRTEVMSYPAIIDRVGGVLVGLVTGLFLASIVRVGIAMAPLQSSVRPTPEQMQADATPRVLSMMSWVLSSDAAVRRKWLYGAAGKPYSADEAAGQVVWGEPYIDENGNDQFDRDEVFLDKDGDGRYSANARMSAEDPGRDYRVGALERYWLGTWGLVKADVGRDGPPGAPGGQAEE